MDEALERRWYTHWAVYLILAAVFLIGAVVSPGTNWRIGSAFLGGLSLGLAGATHILDIAQQALRLCIQLQEEVNNG